MPAKKKTALAKRSTTVTGSNPALVSDLRRIILEAREQVSRAVDSGLVLFYWSIGNRVRTDVLKEKRAEYGQKILHAVSTKLVAEFGQGYSARNLANMIRFAEVFPDFQIVSALGRQLSWTHFRSIIYLDDPLKRDFYAEMCRIENWNTRALRQKIDSMLFERTALSKKPAELWLPLTRISKSSSISRHPRSIPCSSAWNNAASSSAHPARPVPSSSSSIQQPSQTSNAPSNSESMNLIPANPSASPNTNSSAPSPNRSTPACPASSKSKPSWDGSGRRNQEP